MKNTKLKTLAAALAMTLAIGAVPPVSGVSELPALTTTVEAASRKVSLKVSNKKAYVGKTTKISAKATKGAKLSYKTSNKKIATVNSKGVITGKKAGTVKITITAKKSKYKTVKKTITVKVYRQKQKITASNVKLTVGQRKNLGAKARTRLAYKSSNPKVVTVDKKGNLTAKKTGTAKITVTASASGTYNKASRTITVTVVKKKAAPRQTESVKPAQTQKQTETARPTEPPKQTETTRPTEPPKQTETTKPVDPPKETETEAPSPTAPPKETETEAPKPTEPPKETEVPGPTETPAPDVSYVTEMHFNETSKSNTVYIGEPKASTLEWTATGDMTLKDFVFTSSDPSIATVDENGTITGVSVGDVRITAKSKTPFSASGTEDDCLSATYKYHIKVRTTDIDSMYYPEITGEDAITEKNIAVGETKSCTLKIISMGKGSLDDVEFSSSDSEIATVDEEGRVTGKKKGYVTITAKTKLPSEMDGQTILNSSTTYHIGDYTYEEVLNGLTVDTEASRAAHDVLNELRQDKSKRPSISQNYPEASARDWCDACYQESMVRGSRNIICSILNSWNPGEISTVNPLATHGGSQNGYGGDGWESMGTDLGKAATEFFYDGGHAANQTNVRDKYSATAVVQYKNAAGVNLTSMIVTMSPYSYEKEVENASSNSVTWIDDSIKETYVPSSQYYDICNHFGLTWGMETINTVSETSLTDSDEIFTDGSDIHENEPVLADPAPAVAESEETGFESEEPDSEEIDIEDSDSVEEEINITEENEE
ncbi:Ig-like domain-containing protein [Ruminococcus sp. 2227st1_E6_2227SCRN_220401]|uniref:Ig-like domain-containing protein n=1 Tax=unclassified Ruminococcus TaxID=2608920 RepID=UPI00319E5D99